MLDSDELAQAHSGRISWREAGVHFHAALAALAGEATAPRSFLHHNGVQLEVRT